MNIITVINSTSVDLAWRETSTPTGTCQQKELGVPDTTQKLTLLLLSVLGLQIFIVSAAFVMHR